jgi:hypothetical protein
MNGHHERPSAQANPERQQLSLGLGECLLIRNVPKKLDLLYSEAGLRLTDVELFTLKNIQNKSHMRLVLLFSLREGQNVINIHDDKLSKVRMKNRIYVSQVSRFPRDLFRSS